MSWQDQIVGWWNPEDGPEIAGKPPITARDIVRIVRPRAAPTDTTPFKGRIESIGIGPVGDRGLRPLPPRLGRLGRVQAGKELGLALHRCGFQERDPPGSGWTTVPASGSTGRTRASCRAITRTRASGGSARTAWSGRRSRHGRPSSDSGRLPHRRRRRHRRVGRLHRARRQPRGHMPLAGWLQSDVALIRRFDVA